MDLPAWAVWVVIAVFMLAIEATTTAFFTIYFGVAAGIVAALSLAGFGVPIQIVAFGVLSVGGLVLTRPQLKRIAGMDSATVPSGVDAMPGKIGIVTKQIGELETGLVKVGGEVDGKQLLRSRTDRGRYARRGGRDQRRHGAGDRGAHRSNNRWLIPSIRRRTEWHR
jgi:membrane protein implicated in regulation of membrane protease activity